MPAHLTLSYASFLGEPSDHGTPYMGTILNTNTIEQFKAKDYTAILNSIGSKVRIIHLKRARLPISLTHIVSQDFKIEL